MSLVCFPSYRRARGGVNTGQKEKLNKRLKKLNLSRDTSQKKVVMGGCVSSDLGEDAGGGGHSAVHHAVEDGEQAVQREGLRPQKVVTRLERGQNTVV